MLRLRWGAATHTGLVREANEDAYTAGGELFVVADGMGGHSAGEVASAIAVDTLTRAAGDGYRDVSDVSVAVRLANAAIRAEASARPERAGMGTTLTALTVLDPENHLMALANVGDSRTYRNRGGRMSRLTVDHSYVQELVEGGQITVEEARLHPRRNIVTRALGIDTAVQVDTWTLVAATGDRYVLCSDGLVDEVPDHEIADLLGGIDDPQQAADQLVAMANRHGGRDNITVVVVDVVEGASPADLPDDGPGEPKWAEGVAEPGLWADDISDVTATGDTGETGDAAATSTHAAPPSADVTAPLPRTVRAVAVDDTDDITDRPVDRTAVQPMIVPTRAPRAKLVRRRPRRRITVGTFLFGFALAAIATVVIVVALVAAGGDGPAPTTTVVTTTTLPTTTTSRPPLTTAPATTPSTPAITTTP